jgi:4,5:9,10-diseco-3-hydroxy-5,9,17-trioxoandrosta-1(10),2-diene-4-oate hydrolase
MGKVSFEDRYTKVGNVNTRYWSAGEKGSTLILLHGVGCHVEFWERNIAALAREHRVFAVDIVGFGRTDKPEVVYTFELMADFVLDFMKTMGIDKASLVGNSMGGGISLTVAAQAPERVEKIVLVDPVGLGRGVSPVMRLMTVPVIGNVLTKPSRKGVERQMRLCLYDPSQARDDFIDLVAAIGTLPGSQRSFLSFLREMCNMAGVKKGLVADFSALLKKIKTPTLVIWGRQDQILPLADGEAAVQKMANGRLHVMEQAGHLPQIDKPEEFNATVLDFLRD